MTFRYFRRIYLCKNSVRLHTIYYLLANVVSKGFLLISMPFLTALLSPTDFGIITIFDSLYYILVVVSSLAVEESLKRYFFENDKNFDVAAGSMYTTALLFSLLMSFLIYFFKIELGQALNIPPKAVAFAGILAFLALPNNVLLQLLNAKEESKKYAVILTSSSLFNLFFTLWFVFLLTDNKYEGRIYGQLIPAVVLFLLGHFYGLRKFKFGFDRNAIKYFIYYSLPLIPYRLSGILLTYVDSIIIGKIKGMSDTGLYSIAYRVGMGLLLLHTSISMAIEPKIMNLMNDGKDNVKQINRYIENAAKLIFYVAFVLAVFAKYIFMVLVPTSYMDAWNVVPIIVLSYCVLFIYEQFTRINRFYKKTMVNTMSMLLSVVLNIIMNLIFIPIYGYKAAAYTTLISMAFLLLMLWFYTRYIMRMLLVVDVKGLVFRYLIPLSFLYVIMFQIKIHGIYFDIIVKMVLVFLIFIFMYGNKLRTVLTR